MAPSLPTVLVLPGAICNSGKGEEKEEKKGKEEAELEEEYFPTHMEFTDWHLQYSTA